jgi:hypothetical protein
MKTKTFTMPQTKAMRALLFIFCALFSTATLSAQSWNWAKLMSASSSDVYCSNMTADALGNAYIIGIVDEIPVFPNPITPMGSITSHTQGFLTKVNEAGTYQWATIMQATSSVNLQTHIFSNGNIAVVGSGLTKAGPLIFNGVTYKPRYANLSSYFALYDNNGHELSAVVLDLNGADVTNSCQVGDNVYVTVVAKDTLWYNNNYVALPIGQHYGLFRLKFDSSGNVQDILRLGTDNNQFLGAVGGTSFMNVNALGETFIAYTATSANPGNGISVPTLTGSDKIIIIKFDATGTALWATYSNSTISGTVFQNCTIDDQSNLYLSATFKQNIILNGKTYNTVTNNTSDIIVMKITPQGEVTWVDQFNNTSDNSGVFATNRVMAMTYEKGFLYLTGETSGNVNFGPFYHQNTGVFGQQVADKILFLVKMDTTGSVSRFRLFGNGQREELADFISTYNDQVYVGGVLMANIYFDNSPTALYLHSPNANSDYKYNTYLARFDDCNAQLTRSGTLLSASVGTTYQWNVNGSAISNATSQTYDVGANATGKYTVDVTFAGGCISRSPVLAMSTIPAGILTASASSQVISLYPNPTASQLSVSLNLPADGHDIQVQVYNSRGENVRSDQYVNNQNQTNYLLNAQELPQGIYYIILSNGSNTYSSSFIKQ